MKKHCEYCGIEFEAQRKSARFCSDTHRAAFNYARSNDFPTLIELSAQNFEENYEDALNILREYRSPAIVDSLMLIANQYGAEAATIVLRDIMIPLYNFNHEQDEDDAGRH